MKQSDRLPNFELPDQTGSVVKSTDIFNKYLLIFFYPKDQTPGCTLQNCNFRNAYSQFEKYDCAILGISKDNVSSHQKFADKYNLTFPILADTDMTLIKKFDVLVEKSMFGKKYMGIQRSSFLFNEDRICIQALPKVSPAKNVELVINKLHEIQSESN